MKNKIKELNVDFIGGQGSLTKEEEQKISEFIKRDKEKIAKQKARTAKAVSRKKPSTF